MFGVLSDPFFVNIFQFFLVIIKITILVCININDYMCLYILISNFDLL